ncbi:MAG: SIMPL domain-containing protein [Bacteroidales bacterium]|nr:SIMPL domain-containing protein [Bacteroidales bacterium]
MKQLLILLLLIISPIWVNGQFQQQSDNSLRVEGIFITKEKPEKIDFKFTVSYKSLTFETCSDSLMIITKEISDILIKNGVEKELIRVSGISVNENYVYDAMTRIKNGYVGSAGIEIQDNFSQSFTEKMFKSMGSFKYEIEYNVKFSLSEMQKEKLRKNSLEKAIADAKEKAEIIAKQNNLQLIKINRITFEENIGYGLKSNEYDLVKEEEIMPILGQDVFNSELELNPKEISIVKTVLIEWIIKEKNNK